MSKINLDGKAASAVPMDFNVAMAAYFEDCVEVPEETEYPLYNCSPKKRTVRFQVSKKSQNQGRFFFRCPDWNTEDTCKLFIWD